MLGSLVCPAWSIVPVCFLGAELSCYLNAAYCLLPIAVAEGSTRKDVPTIVGPVLDIVSPSRSLMGLQESHWHKPSLLLLFASAPVLMPGFPMLYSFTCLSHLLVVKRAFLLQCKQPVWHEGVP